MFNRIEKVTTENVFIFKPSILFLKKNLSIDLKERNMSHKSKRLIKNLYFFPKTNHYWTIVIRNGNIVSFSYDYDWTDKLNLWH